MNNLKARWQEYCQGIVVDLVQKGITMTLRKTAAGFSVAIRWPGPNGQAKQSFTFSGPDLLKLIEDANASAAKLLPVKCSYMDEKPWKRKVVSR